MDTGSTLYKKLQKSLERSKKAKRRDAANKAAKTRTENQRRRNEEAGLGYHSDNEIKSYRKRGEEMKREWLKNREKKRKEGYEAYLRRKHAEMRARETERRREKRKAEKDRERELARKNRKKASELKKKRAKRAMRDRKRLLKHPIWQYSLNPYKVYVAVNGHCMKNGVKGRFKTLEEARKFVDELVDAESGITFERLSKTYSDGTMESNYEYVIFKDVRDGEAKGTYLRNEFGKYVEHRVEYKHGNFEIVEKRRARVEDTVWVFGFDPRKDRKTFSWVCENILNDGFSGEYDMKRIYLYHNKIVFRNDADDIEIVICKNAADAVRFYATLQRVCRKGPYIFMGSVTTKNAMCESLERLLVERTGWNVGKLRRNQHRF